MDLLLVESTGRLTVLEAKLAKNSEARRAVVAQALAYAAFLKGMEREVVEQKVLRKYLDSMNVRNIAELVSNALQIGSIDEKQFYAEFDRSLCRRRRGPRVQQSPATSITIPRMRIAVGKGFEEACAVSKSGRKDQRDF